MRAAKRLLATDGLRTPSPLFSRETASATHYSRTLAGLNAQMLRAAALNRALTARRGGGCPSLDRAQTLLHARATASARPHAQDAQKVCGQTRSYSPYLSFSDSRVPGKAKSTLTVAHFPLTPLTLALPSRVPRVARRDR